MHFKSLLHVRDHVKVQGRAYNLLIYIALHTNMHTGEAFELTIERQAHRHEITPEWTRMLLNGVIGELAKGLEPAALHLAEANLPTA